MLITILSVQVSEKKTAKGGYEVADVAYKDEKGKTQGKKVMSFVNKEVFEELRTAQVNSSYDVTSKQDKDGYWQWVKIDKAQSSVKASATSNAGTPTPRSNYETPEERAQRQVYIIRQSSLERALQYSQAVKALKSKEEVVELAKYFEGYVLSKDMSMDSLPKDKLESEIEVD